MPRQLKPLKVDEIYDARRGARIEIFYDRNKHDHFAQVGTKEIRDLELAKVRGRIATEIRDLDNITWMGVIVVNVLYRQPGSTHQVGKVTPDDRRQKEWETKLGLGFERVWIGRTPDNRLIEADWELAESRIPNFARDPDGMHMTEYTTKDERIDRAQRFFWHEKHGEFSPPCEAASQHITSYQDPYRRLYLPYDEALWLALHQLEAQLAVLIDRVLAMLSLENNAWQQLPEIMLRGLLPAQATPEE